MENGTPFRKGMEEDFGLPLLIFPLPPFPGSAVLVLDFSEAEVMKRADEMMYVEKRAKQYARGYAAEDTKEVLTK